MSARLAGKTAIITGAGSGIGRATARLFAGEGARLLIVDRDQAGLAATAALIAETGPAPLTVTADAGNEAAVAGIVARAIEEWRTLDVLYANAGVSGGTVPFLETPASL